MNRVRATTVRNSFPLLAGSLLAAALLVGGCSGSAPTLSGVTTTNAQSAGPASGQLAVVMSPEEVAQSGPAMPTNPFSDLAASSAAGGREVITNPTLAEILAPVPGLPEIALGSPDAPVTLVEYASLTCPFCKRFHAEVFPAFKRDYVDTGKVRYILRDFPIGRTSGQASVAIRCVGPDKFIDLFGRFLAQQPNWVSQEVRLEPIHAVAAQVGLTRAQYDTCRGDTQLVESLKAMKDRGRKLGVIGTPNFFVQDKLIKKALDYAELRTLLDAAVAARQTTAAAPAAEAGR